jgi:hypothetical protein
VPVRVATLLVIDRQPVVGEWGEQTLSVPGAVLPMAIGGTIGVGVFVEVEVQPEDTAAQLDVWMYVRPLDESLQVIDEVSELVHVLERDVTPIGESAAAVYQSFIGWIPSYPVQEQQQLWLEARLDNVMQTERAVSLVSEI